MVDIRSEKKEIAIERRSHPRLELHCDANVEKSKQLAKNNIKVTTVPAEIKKKGTKLYVKQVEQQNISNVQNQMSKLGLTVKIIKPR